MAWHGGGEAGGDAQDIALSYGVPADGGCSRTPGITPSLVPLQMATTTKR